MTRSRSNQAVRFLGVSGHPKGQHRFGLLQLLALWKQRRLLAEMDDHSLRDIGLTRTEAMREAERPLWDVPSHWLR